jgi:hypothetical protein
MLRNPRNYPDTMPSAESGREMMRGGKQVAFTIDGIALHDRVAKRPRIAACLPSERRIAFNEQGIFRYL